MIHIEVNGQLFEDFTSASIRLSIDSLVRSFSFSSTNVPENGIINFPFKRGDSCRIIVDNETVLTGFIETITGRGNYNSHILSIGGRGKTADLIDSNLYKPDELSGQSLSLRDIIQSVIENINADINIIDQVNPPLFNGIEDLISPENGMNAFELIEQYARKRQILLSENANGEIVLINSPPESINYKIINRVENDTNNVINYRFNQSDVDLYNSYTVVAAQDIVAISLFTNQILEQYNIDPIIFQTNRDISPIIDNNIRTSRQYVETMSAGYSNEQCKPRAEWSKRVRLARARSYLCTILGYRDFDGNLFDINKTIDVDDDYADINRQQLINSITFKYSLNGSFTELELLEVDAYTSQFETPLPVGDNQNTFGIVSDPNS